jgi:hypothetical protein
LCAQVASELRQNRTHGPMVPRFRHGR